MLRVAAESIAIAWFTIRGVEVAVPAGTREYDLLVTLADGVKRVQVKTTTRIPYDPDAIDYFFVIRSDGAILLIPSRALAGRTTIQLDGYCEYQVGDASSMFIAAPVHGVRPSIV
jgi:hypothetical protein